MSKFEKFFWGCLVCSLLLLIVALFREYAWMPSHETYPHCGVVCSVNYEEDTVACADPQGNIWEFYGCEDWACGDIVAMTMSDAGTPETIYDDEILSVKYCGYM